MHRYLKISFLVVSFSFSVINLKAQADTVKMQQVKSKLILAVCICISKTDTASVNTIQDAQSMLTTCIGNNMDLFIDYATAAGYNISTVSKEKLQELSTYLAAEIYTACPTMQTMVKHVKSQQH